MNFEEAATWPPLSFVYSFPEGLVALGSDALVSAKGRSRFVVKHVPPRGYVRRQGLKHFYI
jgi:hypothetical protein